ncbi:hypothetical protein DFJ77DRAFT_177666 [Powellomyces hirtus]|nr:hypothetical protein DFJ77DRAFT_177666 [Powellomyces hirtus]
MSFIYRNPTPPSTPRRSRPPGGASSMGSIFGDETASATKSSIKLTAPPGGQSSLNFSGEGPTNTSPSIRVLHPTGGKSSLSLDGASDALRTPTRKNPPGGASRWNMDGEGEVTASPSFKYGIPAGGASTLDLAGSSAPPPAATPSIKTNYVQGGSTVNLASDGMGADETPKSFSGRRILSPPGGNTEIAKEDTHASPGYVLKPSWKAPDPDTSEDEDMYEITNKTAVLGGLSHQSALPPTQRSQVVIADDGPVQAGRQQRHPKAIVRKAMHAPGGDSSLKLW